MLLFFFLQSPLLCLKLTYSFFFIVLLLYEFEIYLFFLLVTSCNLIVINIGSVRGIDFFVKHIFVC